MAKTHPCPQCGRPEPGRPAPDPGLCDACLAGPLTRPVPKALTPGRSALAERWQYLPSWAVDRWCHRSATAVKDDRFDHAVSALVDAARLWDPAFGVRFVTYASNCINMRFCRAWHADNRRARGRRMVQLEPGMEAFARPVETAEDVARERVAELLPAILTPCHRRAVELRYGVGECSAAGPMTLVDVGVAMGVAMGVSHELARQLSLAGIKDMRAAAAELLAAG